MNPNDNASDSFCNENGCRIEPTRRASGAAQAPAGPEFEMQVVSDVICPWCLVGKRRLEAALRELANDRLKISVRWFPFELNPDMPKEGMDRKTYRSLKFGSWERSQALDAKLSAAAKDDGVVFRHDLIQRTPNTFDAHRLIWLADRESV